MKTWKHESHQYDLVVCGGGLAGVCAAIAAARNGTKVAILHDRTVLGGNSSSEVRVTPHGAAQHHPYGRETGIIGELLIEERAINHAQIIENGWTNSIWDLVLLNAVYAEPLIDLHLNTKVLEAIREGDSITSVKALVLDSETVMHVQGKIFVDATGDGLVAASAECSCMTGIEGKDTFAEQEAPSTHRDEGMGNSLMFKTEQVEKTAEWISPPWAKNLTDSKFFYESGRFPNDSRGGFWWIELGTPHHTIYDNRYLRKELQSYILGVWNWMKNHDPKTEGATAQRALDWIGSVLGTRESRRIVGRTILTEHDVQKRRKFNDEVAYGGWFLDLHTPGGMLAKHSEENSATNYDPFTEKAAIGFVGPYGIPLSSLIAKDVDNLFLAGRNISASHIALGTVRVMGTTALMGEAVGTAAAHLLKQEKTKIVLQSIDIQAIQQQLLRQGVWLPNVEPNNQNDLAQEAIITASSEDAFEGIEPGQKGYAEEHDLMDPRIDPTFLQRTDTRMVQPIATDGTLKRISIYLTNHSAEETTAEIEMHSCDGIHDYRVYKRDHGIAKSITIAPHYSGWVTVEVEPQALHTLLSCPLDDVESALTVEDRTTMETPIRARVKPQQRYIRLELLKNPDLQWHQGHTCIEAHPALYEVALFKLRRLQHGLTLSCKVEPPQKVYGPQNMITGVARPSGWTNIYRSSKDDTSPHCCFSWEEEQAIKSVEITFAGNLLRSYHAYHPYFKDPKCVKDYDIQIQTQQGWQNIMHVRGNYQRRRVHTFDTETRTKAMRILIHSTWGEKSAGIYEVRIY